MTEDVNDEEFRLLARAAVNGDDEAWEVLVTDDAERLSLWLSNTSQDIQTQLSEKRLDWEAFKASGHHPHATYKGTEATYYKWKRAALRFKQQAEARKRQLRLEVKRQNVEVCEEKAERSRDGARDRAQAQRDHAVESLADLASLVEAFVSGESDDVLALDAALDDLTVLRKDAETPLTLRELLAAVRRHHGEVQAS